MFLLISAIPYLILISIFSASVSLILTGWMMNIEGKIDANDDKYDKQSKRLARISIVLLVISILALLVIGCFAVIFNFA